MATLRTGDVFRLGESLTPEEKLVLIALIDYGARIYPSQGTLALKTGYCVRTIRTVVKSLRQKGLITTKQRGAKALSYSVQLDHDAARDAACKRQEMQRQAAGDAATSGTACSGSRTPLLNHPTNQAPATAGSGGWGVPEVVWNRIVARDPRATLDIEGQRNVTERTLRSYGIAGAEAVQAWQLLLEHWGRTGNRPYDVLTQVVTERSLDGVKDVARVVMHRIREAA